MSPLNLFFYNGLGASAPVSERRFGGSVGRQVGGTFEPSNRRAVEP